MLIYNVKDCNQKGLIIMSYDVSNIVPITVTISPSGLGFANFAKAMFFAPSAEKPKTGLEDDKWKVYGSLPELSKDFPSSTETYKAASRWLGGIPATKELTVWMTNGADASITDTLNKARNKIWWYWSLFDKTVLTNVTTVKEISQWCENNDSLFINSQQVASNVDDIRDGTITNDICSDLTKSGFRHAFSFSNANDPYAGFSVGKWFANINFSQTNSTITAEYKKLAGVESEELTTSEMNSMKTKKCCFYTGVELQGSKDIGRLINTVTHSSYGEYLDDVVNLDAFVNYMSVNIYNTITNQPKKLGQDPQGQSGVIASARQICEQFVSNGFLGARNYLNPDNGQFEYTPGYVILTQPDEILNLLEPDRKARKCAPLRIRIFRKGAIHTAPVDIEVY